MEVSWPGDFGEIHTRILERMRQVLTEANDVVRMYDVTSGDLSTATRTNVAGNHLDGSVQVNGKQNVNIYGDVLAHVDGDYMYVYVMFANGNVSCYRYEAAK